MYEISFKKTTHRFTEKELLDNIANVWDYLNRQPTINDMNVYPSITTFHTYYNRFGSWKKALFRFSEYKNGELEISSMPANKQKRVSLNNSIRYDIMKRDCFKCKICGDSPALTPSTVLEVDHIVPVTKGGENTIDNLQTICRACNSGKNNKL